MDIPPVDAHLTTNIMPSQTGSDTLNPPANIIMPSQTGSGTLNPSADYTSCYRQSPPFCIQYSSLLQICILDIFCTLSLH